MKKKQVKERKQTTKKGREKMSQEQPERPQEEEHAIKYGDVFTIEGEVAEKTVLPRDAAMMQTAENEMMGYTRKGGAASLMQSAAAKNQKAGFAGHQDATNFGDKSMSVTQSQTDMPGKQVITEAIGGQIVGQMTKKSTQSQASALAFQGCDGGITIGEALEATALTAGQKPVEWSDAAAIQAAEVRATGRTTITPGGIAAAAQSAATLNARLTDEAAKTTLADILTDATLKLPADRPATRKDAEGVTGAEMRNDPFLTTHPAGVSASVAAAARLNQTNSLKNK